MKILLLTFFAMLVFAQCPNQSSEKELELKEKELALKEKELELKNKDDESDKKEEKKKDEKPAATPEKKADPAKASSSSSDSKGCALTNRVRFAKGTSAQTFKCELDTNTGNTKHRYTLDAEAGQDLTITFKTTDANYDVTAPDGAGRLNGIYSTREQIQLNKDGRWVISVNLDPGSSFGDYTINFEIR